MLSTPPRGLRHPGLSRGAMWNTWSNGRTSIRKSVGFLRIGQMNGISELSGVGPSTGKVIT